MKDTQTSITLRCTSGTTEGLVEAYNSEGTFLTGKHALLRSTLKTVRSTLPWYTEKLRESKHKQGKAEYPSSALQSRDFVMFASC